MSGPFMKKVLIVEDNEDIRELLNLSLEADFNYDYIQFEGAFEAIEFLKDQKTSDIHMIISDFNMPEGTGGDLYKFIKDSDYNCPFILFTSEQFADLKDFGGFLDTPEKHRHISKPTDLDELHEIFNELSHNFTDGQTEVICEPDDYVRINIKHLYKSNDAFINYYIKLSSSKFVKIIKKGDLYDDSFIKKYQEKGVCFFFATKNDFEQLNCNLIHIITKDLNCEHRGSEEQIGIQNDALDILETSIKNFGLTKQTITLAKNIAKSAIKIINKGPKLHGLLKNLQGTNKDLYQHGLFSSYVATAICASLNWKSHATLEKIAIAAIFHDYKLTEELFKLSSQKLFLVDELETAERKIYLNHPKDAASEIDQDDSIPEGVSQIILQHHETPTGSGFPKQLGAGNTAPISCVFIISEDFIHELGSRELTKKIYNEIKEKFKKKYDKGNYKKPLEGLLKAFNPPS